MNRAHYFLIAAFFSAACVVEGSEDPSRSPTVSAGVVRPMKDCLEQACPGGGGSTTEDPPPDGGTEGGSDAGETKYPDDTPDKLDDPTKAPDLLPVPNGDTYCPRDKEGALVVKIENRGQASSPPTTTRITFAEVGDVPAATPALAAGSEAYLHVPIPPACFTEGGGNCTIVIHADAWLEAAESNESNNEVKAECLGSGF